MINPADPKVVQSAKNIYPSLTKDKFLQAAKLFHQPGSRKVTINKSDVQAITPELFTAMVLLLANHDGVKTEDDAFVSTAKHALIQGSFGMVCAEKFDDIIKVIANSL